MTRSTSSRSLFAIALFLTGIAIAFALHGHAHLAVLTTALAVLAWALRPETRR